MGTQPRQQLIKSRRGAELPHTTTPHPPSTHRNQPATLTQHPHRTTSRNLTAAPHRQIPHSHNPQTTRRHRLHHRPQPHRHLTQTHIRPTPNTHNPSHSPLNHHHTSCRSNTILDANADTGQATRQPNQPPDQKHRHTPSQQPRPHPRSSAFACVPQPQDGRSRPEQMGCSTNKRARCSTAALQVQTCGGQTTPRTLTNAAADRPPARLPAPPARY